MSAARAEFAEWTVAGLHCPSCAASLEQHLKQLGGVTTCEVNFGAGRVGVRYDPGQITLPQLETALEQIGHPPARRRQKAGPPARRLAPQRLRLVATALAGLGIALGVGLQWSDAPAPAWISFYVFSLVCGWV